LVQRLAQERFASLDQPSELAAASATMLAAALLLIHAVGGAVEDVRARWNRQAGV